MTSQQDRRDVRNGHFKQLLLINKALHKSSTPYLCQVELINLGIKRSKMDLRPEDKPDSGPRFCTLFPSDAIDKTIEKAFVDEEYEDEGPPEWFPPDPVLYDANYAACQMGNLMLKYLGFRGFDWNMIASTKWDRTGESTRTLPFIGAYPFAGPEEWGVLEILGIPARYQSHLACVLADGAAADDRLRRSELKCVLQYILRGMLLDKYDEFLVYPVYVYSFSNRDARIIEAHFDGSHLVVRTTPYLNFEEENQENINLYLRWMLSEPVGATKFGIEDGRLCAVTPPPLDLPLSARLKRGPAFPVPYSRPKIFWPGRTKK
ncbi:hypothetical protein MMC07_003156 [Pseudocyphellaria aurata]|nr:hypothetical protein [Pseudocyphellaria aurata]